MPRRGTPPQGGATMPAVQGGAVITLADGSVVSASETVTLADGTVVAAKDVKPVSLELGGKSAMVVFEDCELDHAVEWAMFGAFWTNGQICSATSRLLLQKSIAPKFLARLKKISATDCRQPAGMRTSPGQ